MENISNSLSGNISHAIKTYCTSEISKYCQAQLEFSDLVCAGKERGDGEEEEKGEEREMAEEMTKKNDCLLAIKKTAKEEGNDYTGVTTDGEKHHHQEQHLQLEGVEVHETQQQTKERKEREDQETKAREDIMRIQNLNKMEIQSESKKRKKDQAKIQAYIKQMKEQLSIEEQQRLERLSRRSKLVERLNSLSHQTMAAAIRVRHLRERRIRLLSDLSISLADSRRAWRQVQRAGVKQAEAVSEEDYDLADRLAGQIATLEMELDETKNAKENALNGIRGIDEEAEEASVKISKCFRFSKESFDGYMKDLSDHVVVEGARVGNVVKINNVEEKEMKACVGVVTVGKQYEAVIKSTAMEDNRLTTVFHSIEKDEGCVMKEKKNLEKKISSETVDTEKLRDTTREKLDTTNEEIQILHAKIAKLKQEANTLSSLEAGYNTTIAKVRSSFSNQIKHVEIKSRIVSERRATAEGEKDAFECLKETHAAILEIQSGETEIRKRELDWARGEAEVAGMAAEVTEKEITIVIPTVFSAFGGVGENKDDEKEVDNGNDMAGLEAAAEEAKLSAVGAREAIDDLERDADEVDARLSTLARKKKAATSGRDFKAASRISRESKRLESKKERIMEELEGETLEWHEIAQGELVKANEVLKRAKSLTNARDYKDGLKKMQQLVVKIIQLERSKKKFLKVLVVEDKNKNESSECEYECTTNTNGKDEIEDRDEMSNVTGGKLMIKSATVLSSNGNKSESNIVKGSVSADSVSVSADNASVSSSSPQVKGEVQEIAAIAIKVLNSEIDALKETGEALNEGLKLIDEDTNDIIQDSISFSSLLDRLSSSYDELEIGEEDIVEKIMEKVMEKEMEEKEHENEKEKEKEKKNGNNEKKHGQEKKKLEVKKIEGQKIKGKEREDDRIEKKEREEKETKQIKKSDKNEEKGNNGENSRKLEVNEVLPIVEEMKECADMEGENKDRNEELHKKESEQEPLTMTTHTNIDIGAFRISDSNKEKNIDQTNSDDCPHEHLPLQAKTENMDDVEKKVSEDTIIDESFCGINQYKDKSKENVHHKVVKNVNNVDKRNNIRIKNFDQEKKKSNVNLINDSASDCDSVIAAREKAVQLITRVRKELKHKELTSVIKQVEEDMKNAMGKKDDISEEEFIVRLKSLRKKRDELDL